MPLHKMLAVGTCNDKSLPVASGVVYVTPFCLPHLSPAFLLRKSVKCLVSSPLCLFIDYLLSLKELIDLPVDPR